MMPRDGQIHEKEFLSRFECVDPTEHLLNSGGFIDAEAGVEVAADAARIFRRLEPPVPHNAVHAEIHESSRVKEGCAITLSTKNRGHEIVRKK